MTLLSRFKQMFKRKEISSRKAANSFPKGKLVLEKHEISVDQLQAGMTVIELDRPWTDLPTLFQEYSISNSEDIALIRKYCKKVTVDYLSYSRLTNQSAAQSPKTVRYKQSTYSAKQVQKNLQKELPKAEEAFDASRKHISNLMQAVQEDSKIDIESSRLLVGECVSSILRNPDALFWLSKIKNQDEYTSEHCLRVGILAIAFGKHLQLSKAELKRIGLCGMLHDVGKMKVPSTILQKENELTSDEYQIIKEHTILGYIFLKEHGGIDEEVCTVAYNHHERVDGKGYPRKIDSNLLSYYDKIISIVDGYDAMTSDRSYRKGISPAEALAELYNEKNSQYDADLVTSFIQMVGIYPVGSLVALNNGFKAIVLSVNPDHKLDPVIEIIMNEKNQRVKPLAVDLSLGKTYKGEVLAVSHAIADGDLGINIQDYLQ